MGTKEKYGQITIFVIVAVLIVVVIVGILFLFKNSSEKKIKYDSVEDYVNYCLEHSIKDALLFNSIQGGYFLPPNNSINEEFLFIPIYWDSLEGKSVLSIDEIEEQMSEAIKFGVEYCVGEFDYFKEQGLDIQWDKIKNVDTKIYNDTIISEIEFPIYVGGEVSKEYESFSESVIFKFPEKYNLVLEAINLQEKIPNEIPLTRYSELAYENNFTFEVFNMGESRFIYSFIFDDEIIPGVKYLYNFGAQYGEDE